MASELNTAIVAKKRKNYFRLLQQEFFKVSWTNKDELTVCTKIVLWATLVFALAIYFAELAIRVGLHLIGLMARLIGG